MKKVNVDELVGLLQELRSNVVDMTIDNLDGYVNCPDDGDVLAKQVAVLLKNYSELLSDWDGEDFNETSEAIEEQETTLKQLVDQFTEVDDEEADSGT